MSDESTASRSAIHQSLTRPLLLAGAERKPAIANWITAAAIFFGGPDCIRVHRDDQRTASDGWTLGARASG